ncbi:MAG TPA: pyruvate synthase subunit beta [Dehalococcoidia bacterium]|nr:pyruvate synthase subunit beta [Dehalococcoidia bacterium]
MPAFDRDDFSIPRDEYLYSGHSGCPGCGATLTMRHVLKAMGPRTVVVVCASCWTGIAGYFPTSSLKVPSVHCAFASAAATASGLKAALEMRGDDISVLAWAGDGGTLDIGLQGLSAAAERNDDILYICYDNEAYMNTGIQRSSATPLGAWTTTTPLGQDRPNKNIMDIMVAHGVPYAATVTIGFPSDLMRKVSKAKGIRGTRFIHALSPCPTGWRFAPHLTVKIARLAVESKAFPLYEVEQGEYIITHMPRDRSLKEYLELQGRFKDLTDDEVQGIQDNLERAWQRLMAKSRIATYATP